MSNPDDEHRRRMQQDEAIRQKQDDEQRRSVRLGISPACPKCGSHRFVDATKVEECLDCGYGHSYW